MSIITDVDLLKYRRTKIVATIGPGSRSAEVIRGLIEAGVDMFRINLSHGEHAEHDNAIALIRGQAAALGRHTAILADLCGPKIRTGKFRDGAVTLVAGDRVTVTTRDVVGDAELIPSQYAALPRDVKAGDRILLNDGAVELVVERTGAEDVLCRVVAGGPVGNHKGINLPGVAVSAPSLTDKDIIDAQFALALAVDFIALSFVRRREDVDMLREIIAAHDQRPGIIAKIEKPEALRNSLEIIAAADGIMVARGDLGVELHPEQVPLAQIQLIHRARLLNKPVIVATQMLESMITNARPTRAEVTDVSHAVANGTDAVMLSGETAVGAHPLEAVRMMVRIARQTESYHFHSRIPFGAARAGASHDQVSFGDAVARAVAHLVTETKARAVVVISMRGMTAGTISAVRPDAPIVAISRHAETCRRMNMLWGVIPHLDESVGSENPNAIARRAAQALALAERGDFIVLVRGFHSDPELNTPTVTLLRV